MISGPYSSSRGRGSTPRLPQKDLFFLRDAHRKSFARRSTFSQDRGCRIADPLSHWCRGRPRPAHELHPLARGNQYMSRRRRMSHTNAHAPTLAEFWFALILASSSCVAPPTEMNFHLLVWYRRSHEGNQAPSLANIASILPPTPYH